SPPKLSLLILLRLCSSSHSPYRYLPSFPTRRSSDLSGLVAVYRSTTCNASLWKFPALSNQDKSLKPVVSTTSVSPSQCPFDHPRSEERRVGKECRFRCGEDQCKRRGRLGMRT